MYKKNQMQIKVVVVVVVVVVERNIRLPVFGIYCTDPFCKSVS